MLSCTAGNHALSCGIFHNKIDLTPTGIAFYCNTQRGRIIGKENRFFEFKDAVFPDVFI